MLRFEKYYGLFIAYKSIVNGKSRKSLRRDKNANLCFRKLNLKRFVAY